MTELPAFVLPSRDVLRHIRPTILVTDRFGTILQAHGGSGCPLGYAPEELEGQHGLLFVAPEDHQIMAEAYIGSDQLPIVTAPEPFPVRMVSPDGHIDTWDCVPSGFTYADTDGWILTMTCRAEQNASIDARDCFIAGGTSRDVTRVVAEHYQGSSQDSWRKTALALYRDAQPNGNVDQWGVVATSDPLATELTDALQDCIDDEDAPWNVLQPGALVPNSQLPARLRDAAAAAGFPYCTALAVGLDDLTQIVFLRLTNFSNDLQVNNRLADNAVASTLCRALVAERARAVLDETLRSDPLTGIANRRHFDEVIASAEPTAPQAALYVDIDNFKRVNDTYGHAAGDETLKVVARRIVGACRPDDTVARIGGDEFAVILSHVTRQEAERVAARIQASMHHAVNVPDGPKLISVTIGIAASNSATDLSDLVRSADQAMLAQKPSAQPHDRPVDLRQLATATTTATTTAEDAAQPARFAAN